MEGDPHGLAFSASDQIFAAACPSARPFFYKWWCVFMVWKPEEIPDQGREDREPFPVRPVVTATKQSHFSHQQHLKNVTTRVTGALNSG